MTEASKSVQTNPMHISPQTSGFFKPDYVKRCREVTSLTATKEKGVTNRRPSADSAAEREFLQKTG
jgi:hypothetical protein